MFIDALRAARKAAGLSQKALSERLHISQQAYAKYETGVSSPNPEMLAMIANTLGISADTLLGTSFHLSSDFDVELPENTEVYPAPDPIAAIGFSADLTDEERARLKMVIDITLESILREREHKKNADTVNEQNKK